jgi:2,5-diketo-D-gluconate reductase A
MALAPTVKLNDGNEIPQFGLGTWPMKDDQIADVIPQAAEQGYRLIDTAVNYGNEVGVGRGIRAAGIPREELFVTTKVPGRHHGYDATKRSLEESLERMQLDYVDLYLIHWPNPKEDKYVATWRAFVDLQKEGKVRSIGVSNFKAAHLDRLRDETGVLPSVNQIQLYPSVSQIDASAYNEQLGIAVESWSPLGRGANAKYYGGDESYLDIPLLREVAAKYGKTTGQIVLRWHVQQGLIPLPKSSNVERLTANIAVFDFSLEDSDMQRISSLDDGRAEVANSDERQEF